MMADFDVKLVWIGLGRLLVEGSGYWVIWGLSNFVLVS